MKRLAFITTFLLGAILHGLAGAQEFPSKPIRILVGFAPGGAPDILARIVAKKLNDNLGQAVIVDNKAGASGNIAAQALAKAEPDGHTLLMATVSVAIAPSIQPSLGIAPEKDFDPVGMVASVPLVLVANSELGVRNVSDLVALAKSRPGKLNYASVGAGSPQHLTGELFQLLGGVKLVHVPYKGGGPATQSVLSGETAIYFAGMPPAMPFIKAGKVRALAVTSSRRSSAAPEVPTMDEAGMKGFDVDNWHAVYAPRGTPPAVLAKLNSELQRALSSPDVKQQMLAQGAEVWSSSPQQARDYLAAEVSKWAKVVKSSGTKAE